jgi:biotin transport system substrate-specific component
MYIKLVLCVSIAVLTGVLAQLSFWLGPIPYTFQNTGIVLAGLLLDPLYAFLSMVFYVVFVVIGLPMAAGFRGGIHVVLGYTGGYIIGFIFSAPLMSILKKYYLKLRNREFSDLRSADFVLLLLLTLIATLPTYILGFIVFAYHALGNEKLMSWVYSVSNLLRVSSYNKIFILFVVSVLVFIPQDLFMDHVVAITLARYIHRILVFKGVKIE